MQVLKEEIRRRILEISEELFYEAGFAGTTTRNIAAKVGISVSNLYLYYDNKEAIFAAVIGPFHEYLNSRLMEFLDINNSLDDVNTKLYRIVINLITKDRRRFIILSDRSSGTKFENSRTMAVQALKGHICSLLASAIEDRDLISYILANNFINGIVEIAKSYRDEKQLEDSLRQLITHHTNGLKALIN